MITKFERLCLWAWILVLASSGLKNFSFSQQNPTFRTVITTNTGQILNGGFNVNGSNVWLDTATSPPVIKARMTAPTPSELGGVLVKDCGTQVVGGVDATGSLTCKSAITVLPAPTTSVLGGVKALDCGSLVMTGIDGTGTPICKPLPPSNSIQPAVNVKCTRQTDGTYLIPDTINPDGKLTLFQNGLQNYAGIDYVVDPNNHRRLIPIQYNPDGTTAVPPGQNPTDPFIWTFGCGSTPGCTPTPHSVYVTIFY